MKLSRSQLGCFSALLLALSLGGMWLWSAVSEARIAAHRTADL